MSSSEISSLQIGAVLPPFDLPRVVATAIASTCNNENLRGAAFVLFVYPKDATSGCTIEACGFRDLHSEFETIDVQVFGLSRDGVRSHERFIEAQNLPYALLADSKQETLKSWNLIIPGTMYGKPVTKVARTTIAVDAKGIVRQIWRDVTPIGHATAVLDWCRENRSALQT